MIDVYDVIKRPLVTEKGVTKKDGERTLCFEVAADANKTQIRQAVEAAVQGEGGRGAHLDHGGQAAPARAVFGLSRGLEEGLRAAEGRREDAGVRGDLSSCQ